MFIKLEANSNFSVLDPRDNWILMKGLHGARVPKLLDDWEAPAPQKEKPSFEKLDNSEDWYSFSLRPNFKDKNNTGAYNYHYLPTGATFVPMNKKRERKVDDWNFHYSSWKEEGEKTKQIRHGANATNLFPPGTSDKLFYWAENKNRIYIKTKIKLELIFLF